MKQLKILFVIDSLGEGGAERSLAELLPYFVNSNIDCKVICMKMARQGVQKEVESQGFEVRYLLKKSLSARFWEFRRILTENRPDIVHTTLFNSNLLGRFGGIGIPVRMMNSLVNTSYDPIRFLDYNIKANRLRIVRAVDSWSARHFTMHFHAVSKAAMEAAISVLKIPEGRISVVERGRDPKRLGEPGMNRTLEARKRLDLHPEDEVLVTVGRQDYQKGQRYLLEAIERMVPNHPRLVVLVAGRRGSVSDELDHVCASPGIKKVVRFLGHRDDVPDILAASDVFVFPSLYEGLGCAAIEAMALGLPIVASDLTPLREVLEHQGNALLVPRASPADLANAIQRVLSDRTLANKFGIRSRQIFQERFTLDRSAARMIDLYHKVAAMPI